MQKEKTTKATALAFFGYTLWGFSFYFSRLGLDVAQPFVMLAHRFTLAVLLSGLLLAVGAVRLRLRGRRLGLLLLMGVFEPVLYFVGEEYGILYTTTAFSGVMIATIPVFALGGSALFLREKATRSQLLWSLLSVAGVVVVALQGSGDGSVSLKGVCFLLLAVVGATAYTILSRKLAGDFSAFERTFVSMAEGALAYWVLAAIQCRAEPQALWEPLTQGRYWLSVGYLGCVASVICYFCINHAFTYLTVNRLAIGTNLVTVISVFAGVLLLDEPFSWVSAAAAVVILAGIYGVQRTSEDKEVPARE